MSLDIEFVLESAVRGFHVIAGRLDVFPDRDRPSRTSDRGRGDGTCPAAVEPRLTIESFRSRPPAPQRRRRS